MTMNPLWQAFLGSLVRFALAGVSMWAVQHGIFTESEAGGYVEAAAVAIPVLLWSFWGKYRERLKLVFAAYIADMTEKQIERSIKSAQVAGVELPSTMTPKHETPKVE